MMKRLVLAFVSLVVVGIAAAATQDQKLKIEDVVARHLDSIGSAEARAKVTSRVASGKTVFASRIGGATNIEGQGMIVSAGSKLRAGFKFPLIDYTGEDMAFDGNRAATGLLPQGRRSPLSIFLNSQNLPLKDGLLGGALSTAWPLLHLDQLQPKLEYKGLKKIEGRSLHEVSYRPRKGSPDLKVALYFEADSFRHVRTKYSFEVAASVGTRENANVNQETFYSLTEDFDDFRALDGMTLPHKYRLQYNATGARSLIQDWTFSAAAIAQNQKVDDEVFVLK
jgi:hypothetical protein